MNSLRLFSSFFPNIDGIVSVYCTMTFDEQFYSTYSKHTDSLKLKNKGLSEMICDMQAEHAFNVYNLDNVFYIHLFIVTHSSFHKCIGIGKIDNLARHAISKKQEVQSILFFPNNGNDTRASSAIAATEISCDYKPKVDVPYLLFLVADRTYHAYRAVS